MGVSGMVMSRLPFPRLEKEKDRKLLSDEKRIASGRIGCQENKIQDVV
jgi:hypothetical protein